ncbi:plasmalemma vesicle-associated protein [Octodon degus]|uniref:Plasmalemma vesicle-associated protein n=1 Tax=Octodon degus TaxID=10160 RepID=A0A6P6DTS5_OCTDE|nr:plasmalemma vesicle-associated protein [Octodon degus]
MGLAMQAGAPYTRAGGAARGCWYYLRYFFLFASLIQLLIIAGLVLFMVYGNVHHGTEANLQDTERRAAALHAQVVALEATRANLTRELNVTARAKDAIMQMLLGARRDLDGLNASFRQCQTDRVSAPAAGREGRGSPRLPPCAADRLLMKEQQSKMLEMELAKEKAQHGREKEEWAQVRRELEKGLTECSRAKEQLAQQRQLAERQLQLVQGLCAPLDHDKLLMELRTLWRDSVIMRSLDSLAYGTFHSLGADLSLVRRACDQLPAIMATKGEELANRLRSDIQRVAHENTELRAQKLEAEQRVRDLQAEADKAKAEAAQREAQARVECTRLTQLARDQQEALRREREALGKELEERKQQVAQLRVQVEVKQDSLQTCLKAKSQPINPPRLVPPALNLTPIDPESLEKFKKMILESQGVSLLQVRT